MDSPRFTLTKTDLTKVGIGFLIALGGTALSFIADTLQLVDFGELKPIAVVLMPIVMAAVNAARLWLKDNTPTV